MRIKNLLVYPVKSIGGIQVQNANCLEAGLEHDRRMMLVDENGRFISQREYPEMALISGQIEEKGFTIFTKKDKDNKVFIPFDVELQNEIDVSVWDTNFKARCIDSKIGNWFNDVLGINSTLVKMDTSTPRYKKLHNSDDHTKVSMADGYPYLIISEASLANLNNRLNVPVPMDRFRPNIIVDQINAYGEEKINSFHSEHVEFKMIKPCTRCVMITIDQKTSNKLVEPLKTLSSYKKQGNKVNFGMNAIIVKKGILAVGDEMRY